MIQAARVECKTTRTDSSRVSVAQVRTGLPRWIEFILAALGLIAVSPVLLIAAVAIKVSSRGPIIFRQERMGRRGRRFWMYKLRSMAVRRETGTTITAANDPRVTSFGRLLRKTKLDELPELWNILKGDMSIVGPRPEVPEYVDLQNPSWNLVLQVRPGLTDPMTLLLRNEEALLGLVREDRESFYLRHLQPFKLAGYLAYLAKRNWWTDLKVIGSTARAVVANQSRCPSVEEITQAANPAGGPARTA